MDDAIFSGRHDNMDDSESAVDSVTKLKEYLISAIREWSRILVGKDKSRENIWLPAHAPNWWLHTYPPWRNPTGKKKDTLEELKIKYNILQEKLLYEEKFPKRWEEQTFLYQKSRYQDLFLLTRLIKVSEELREKEQELKEIVAETFNIYNFSAASVIESLVQSGVSIQSEVKKLQEKLGRNDPLGSESSESVNLSVEKKNNNSPTVLKSGQNKTASALVFRKTFDTNTTHLSPPTFCMNTTASLHQNSPHTSTTPQQQSTHTSTTPQQQSTHTSTTPQQQSTHTSTTPQQQSTHTSTTPQQQSTHTSTTPQQHSPHTTNTLVPCSPTTTQIEIQPLHKTTTIRQHPAPTLTTQQQQSTHTTTILQKQPAHTTPTLPIYTKLSLKRTATEYHTEISPKFPKVNPQTAMRCLSLQIINAENSINLNPAEVTRADFSLDFLETDEDKTIDNTNVGNREKPLTPSPDEGISSEGFMSDSDSAPESDHTLFQLDAHNDHHDTPKQSDLDLVDGTFNLYQYVLN